MDVGDLRIVGEMDTQQIDSGFNKINQDFAEMENQAGQTNASMGVLSKTTSRLSLGLIAAGTAGVTALTGLAMKSPVLAGTMAKIEVETLKLSNTVGRQLKPIFDTIAQNPELIADLNTRLRDPLQDFRCLSNPS